MPIELPACRGEYAWSRSQSVPVTILAIVELPHRVDISVHVGRDLRQQSLSLGLALSTTGYGHLVLGDIAHHGPTDEAATTKAMLYLLLNTTVSILLAHCPRRVSLGGNAPSSLRVGSEVIAIPWGRWGFHLLQSRQRLLAQVRHLKVVPLIARTENFPLHLPLEQLQWTPR
jgi:hypothetical protein